MKKLILILPIMALAACGEEPAPAALETAAPVEVVELPAPDQELFTAVFAETCPDAEPVATAVCRRGMGAPTVACEFGLGDDDVLRHDATLNIDDTGEGWMLADAENICSEHDSHHVDN
ncbi:hypothetical protein [Aurantiacibacter marinus]|uniref:Lipoprotein n=1 Tax=Aurantiacibacter marinus TaxID=874156 RepID=A0A0H0XKR1_9SPHN|nr:hypothetical protein [Aurantiacibacter marinus]KLI63208.1 hypothetical protein AAV99_11055 [Aurantiacibacter marinus]